MEYKKSSMKMSILVSLILALILLVSYIFFMQGTISGVLEDIGLIRDGQDQRVDCIVEPWTNGDTTGDGIKNTEECEGLS